VSYPLDRRKEGTCAFHQHRIDHISGFFFGALQISIQGFQVDQDRIDFSSFFLCCSGESGSGEEKVVHLPPLTGYDLRRWNGSLKPGMLRDTLRSRRGSIVTSLYLILVPTLRRWNGSLKPGMLRDTLRSRRWSIVTSLYLILVPTLRRWNGSLKRGILRDTFRSRRWSIVTGFHLSIHANFYPHSHNVSTAHLL
jgi:hypothetical protein